MTKQIPALFLKKPIAFAQDSNKSKTEKPKIKKVFEKATRKGKNEKTH